MLLLILTFAKITVSQITLFLLMSENVQNLILYFGPDEGATIHAVNV